MIANFMLLSKHSKKYRFEGVYTHFFYSEKENIQSAKHEFSWNLNKNKFTFRLDTGCLCSIANESLAGKKKYETTRFFVFLLANNLNKDINLLPFIEGLLEKKIENTEILARAIFSLAALGRLFLFGANVSF